MLQAGREHEVERGRMTTAERSADDKGFEDTQADLAVQSRLGGGKPENLEPDDDPAHH